jgi:hypothetical protein
MSNAPEPVSRRGGRLSSNGAIGLLVVLYLLVRVPSLGVLPIFLDEAVHIQWAERLYAEGRILRPVGAGRLLAVAAFGLALPFDDRLWAARLLATVAGALTLVFTALLARGLFGARAGVIAGGLYLLSPFALTYDRLALSDGFLAAAIAGAMFAAHRLGETPTSVRARIGLAVPVLLAVLSKVSAPLFVLSLPLGAVALAKDRRPALRAAAIATGLGIACASPMLWFFAANSGEIASQHVAFAGPGAALLATLRDMRGWVVSYFTIPALLAAAASLFLLRDRRAVWLAASVGLPLFVFALVSQPWSARYILPTLPALLVLIAGGVEKVAARFKPGLSSAVALVLTLGVSFQGLTFDRYLLLDPARAPFPPDDRHQLVTGWPSGYGVREAASRLRREAARRPLVVFIDTGGVRTMATSLAVLLSGEQGVSLIEANFEDPLVRDTIRHEARKGRTLALLGPRASDLDFKSLMEDPGVERLEVFTRPQGEWAGTLFELGVGSPAPPRGGPRT